MEFERLTPSMIFLNNPMELYTSNENDLAQTWTQVDHFLNISSEFVDGDASPSSSSFVESSSSNALLNSFDESLASPSTPLSPQSDESDYGPSGGSPHQHATAPVSSINMPARSLDFDAGMMAAINSGAELVKPAKSRSRRSRDPNKVKVERNRGACEKHKRDRKRCPLDCKNRTLFFKKK